MRLIDADAMIGELHHVTFLEGDDRSICYGTIQRQPTINTEPQMSDTSKQAVVEEIRKVMRQALYNLPTRLEDGEEVYADMDAANLILDINKKLSEAIWRMK
jgi:hypothetical protein